MIHDLRPGGTERRLIRLLAALDSNRFEPLVACVNGLGALAFELAPLGIDPWVIGRRRRRDLDALRRLAALVRRERPAVVHGWLGLGNAFARIGGRLGGARIVVAGEGAVVRTANRRKRRLEAAIDLALNPLTDAHVANSTSVAVALRARGIPSRKISVIPNGVPVPWPLSAKRVQELRVTLGAQPGDELVGMVSRLDAEFKDHPTFLRAVALLRSRRPRLRIAVIGDGPARKTLEVLAKDLGIADAVRFAGYRPDAAELVAALDVSVLCTLSEGFSNVILEAMASRRPIVASDIPPNREAIVHNVHGLLCPVRNPHATAAAIERLLTDARLSEALATAARHRVADEFSLDRQAARTMELYDRLLRAKGRYAAALGP